MVPDSPLLVGVSMVSFSLAEVNANGTPEDDPAAVADGHLDPLEAEEILQGLAGVFAAHHNPEPGKTHRVSAEKGPIERSAQDAMRNSRISKPDIAPWSSRSRRSCSWLISIAASARPM